MKNENKPFYRGTSSYIRLNVKDKYGVLSDITRIFSNNKVSIFREADKLKVLASRCYLSVPSVYRSAIDSLYYNANKMFNDGVKFIKMKQTSKLTEWEKLHPNYAQDPKLLNEWQQILNSMTEDVGQRDKVKEKLKRNMAEHVQLKQALTDAIKN